MGWGWGEIDGKLIVGLGSHTQILPQSMHVVISCKSLKGFKAASSSAQRDELALQDGAHGLAVGVDVVRLHTEALCRQALLPLADI